MVVCREGGGIGLLITLVPKVLYNVFLFFSLTTLETSYFYLIGWFKKLSVQIFNH